MALHVPKAPGFASMLKDGAQHYSGLEEAVFRNIEACKEFGQTLRTAYGPQGRNKMIINHIEKLFVTSDAATIINNLEIEHPAAKLLVLATEMQEQEAGDGTNWVIMFAAALLEKAEELIKMGLTPTDVADGYQRAVDKALEILPDLQCWKVTDTRDIVQIRKALRGTLMSKQHGYEDFLADLIGNACISIQPEKTTFNVDNIRICKIPGSGVSASSVVHGMVFQRGVEGTVTEKNNAKVAVYSCPFDITTTETKGTVLINTAEELEAFSRGEEVTLEAQVKALSESGINVMVAGGKIGDLSLHYLNKYDIMAVRITSKWDLRRLCRTVGAVILPKLCLPSSDEMGLCDRVFLDEIGDVPVTIFRQEGTESRVATVVVRGSTKNVMDDIERAVDDGVNTFKGLCRDGRYVAGAGSTEIELSRRIEEYSRQCPGLEQYSIKAFAEALRTFPKMLAENSGASGQETVANLMAKHEEGGLNYGFDCESGGPSVFDANEKEILDLMGTKYWALKYASSAACQVLRVDQIIMAKRAGGPKAREMGPQDPDDDE
uniref:T-complex protein 1 subunit theta n=1 Tax=Hirondellea gigas TaxID=1518452 RepID=A0A2P2HX97_9CRUS